MSDNLPNLDGFDSTTSSTFGSYVPDGVPETDAKDVNTMNFSNWYASNKENDLLQTLMRGPIPGESVDPNVQNEISNILKSVNTNVPLFKNQLADTLVDQGIYNKTLWMVLLLILIIFIVWRYFKK